jgi:hypothetical protein
VFAGIVGVAGSGVEVGGCVINEFNNEVAVALTSIVGVAVACSETKTFTGVGCASVTCGSTKVFA